LAQTLGGQRDSAVRTLERGIQVRPETPGQYSALVLAYAAAGRWADAERVRAQLRRPGGDPSGGVLAAFADLVFGDREPLVRLLSTEAGQRGWLDSEGAFGCHPLLDPLWADARFRAAMRRLSVDACPLARPWPVPPPARGARAGRRRDSSDMASPVRRSSRRGVSTPALPMAIESTGTAGNRWRPTRAS
jgi:hypothetical protein